MSHSDARCSKHPMNPLRTLPTLQCVFLCTQHICTLYRTQFHIREGHSVKRIREKAPQCNTTSIVVVTAGPSGTKALHPGIRRIYHERSSPANCAPRAEASAVQRIRELQRDGLCHLVRSQHAARIWATGQNHVKQNSRQRDNKVQNRFLSKLREAYNKTAHQSGS